jgi:glutamyl-tRNA synthetase
LLKERITFPQDLFTQARFFFIKPPLPDATFVQKKWNSNIQQALKALAQALAGAPDVSSSTVKALLEAAASGHQLKTGQLMQPLRVALTGEAAGPDLLAVMEILGKEECILRLNNALKYTETLLT